METVPPVEKRPLDSPPPMYTQAQTVLPLYHSQVNLLMHVPPSDITVMADEFLLTLIDRACVGK